MSHEIRTPMNAIIGIAELLAKTPLSAEQDKYVQIFRRAGDNLLHLINDILDLSKVEASQLELERTRFSLDDLLGKVTEMVAVRAHAHEEIAVEQQLKRRTSIERKAKRGGVQAKGVAGTLNQRLQWRYPDAECERCSHHAFIPDQPHLEAHRAFGRGQERDQTRGRKVNVAYALSGLEEHFGQPEVYLLAAGDQLQALLAGKGGEQAIARGGALEGQEVSLHRDSKTGLVESAPWRCELAQLRTSKPILRGSPTSRPQDMLHRAPLAAPASVAHRTLRAQTRRRSKNSLDVPGGPGCTNERPALRRLGVSTATRDERNMRAERQWPFARRGRTPALHHGSRPQSFRFPA